MDAQRGAEVIVVIVAHGADDAQIVGTLSYVWKQVRHFKSALTELLKRERGPYQELGLTHNLAMIFGKLGLRIERVHVGNAARHI